MQATFSLNALLLILDLLDVMLLDDIQRLINFQ